MDPLGGALLVDKPVGPTSHDIVSRVRKAAGLRRVGHAGTLDPFASGLLVVLLGPATRLSEYLLGLDKKYTATARLGVETTTCDPEGEVVAESRGWENLSKADVEDALASFHGTTRQRPPVYSAKKVRGESAHRRIRRGEAVELEDVEVTVMEIQLVEFSPPEVRFRVSCSSGTYVRALGRDLGRKLGTGAYLTELRRTGIGDFSVEGAVTLEDLEEGRDWGERVLSPARALTHLPAVPVGPEEARRLRHGQEIPCPDPELAADGPVRILQDEELVGIGSLRAGWLKPRKVLVGA